MRHYLYIFEDGEMKQTTRPPNDEEILSIADGVLTVVSFCEPFGRFIQVFDNVGGRGEIPTL
jgi:hypothetical protein